MWCLCAGPIAGSVDSSALEEMKALCSSAMFTVLRQEVDRFNSLLGIMHRSLRSLMLAVKGEVVMSEALEEAYNALLNQRVPAQWKVLSHYHTLTPPLSHNVFVNR